MMPETCELRWLNGSLTTSSDYNSDTATTPYILDEFAYCKCTPRHFYDGPSLGLITDY